MRSRRTWLAAVALAALAAAAPGATILERLAGGRVENLVVRKFLVGRLEDNTDRFIARGGRDEQAALRDEVLLMEFSSPVDIATVDLRTVRIGIPTTPGLMIQAKGAIYPYIEKKFDPVSGGFVFSRRWRNRILFDPTARLASSEAGKNPYGWEANSLYTVTIPGTDTGSPNTVTTPRGSPLIRTFRTTFRTVDAHLVDYLRPVVVSLEATDAPGVPLDGRTDVDPLAGIVAAFDEPMLASSFDPAATFRLLDPAAGAFVPGDITLAPGGRSATFRIDAAYAAGSREIRVTITAGVTDVSGNPLYPEVAAGFRTR